MRQAANALLAAPKLATTSLGALLRRSTVIRVSLAISLAFLLAAGVFGAGRPAPAVATPPVPIVPLTQAAFTTTVSTDRGLAEPATIIFSTPMDPASVAEAVTVEPRTDVRLTWSADGTGLTIAPRTHWAAGTLQMITVKAGALARSGQPLAKPARAVFLTRGATTGNAAPTERLGARVALTTDFVVSFARPVDATTVPTAIRLDPPTPGIVRSSSPTEAQARFTFEPLAPLLPDVDYRLVVSGVRDADGVQLATVRLKVHTTTVPTVVRFRPLADSRDVARQAALSVSFTEPMDRRSTARAFSVTVGGKAVAGKIRWTERDTVLVFTPNAPLPYAKTVKMDVSVVAKNTAGAALPAPVRAIFRTVARGVVAAPVTTTAEPTATSTAKSKTGGGAVGGGSWAAVETYYLGLMNCTRTGGWVTSSGKCSSPGGRDVAALKLDSGISSKVARPYAKRLATGADCSHFIGGSPYDRLRRAGYTNQTWAENIGCRGGGARSSVLATHLFYQSEKSYNGGHYRNLMSTKYDRVGIGVWVSGGRVRLVVDFYHP